MLPVSLFLACTLILGVKCVVDEEVTFSLLGRFDLTFCQMNALRDLYEATSGKNWDENSNWMRGGNNERGKYVS